MTTQTGFRMSETAGPALDEEVAEARAAAEEATRAIAGMNEALHTLVSALDGAAREMADLAAAAAGGAGSKPDGSAAGADHIERGLDELARVGETAFDRLETIANGVIDARKFDGEAVREAARQTLGDLGKTLLSTLLFNPLRNRLFSDPGDALLPALITLPGTLAGKDAPVPGAPPAGKAKPPAPTPAAQAAAATAPAAAAAEESAAPSDPVSELERINEALREKLDLLEQEMKLIALAPEAKARERAELEAINDLKEKGINLESEAARKYVELRGEEAARQHRLQATQAAWTAVEEIGVKALNDLEAAFATLFQGGEDGAEQFQAAMKKMLAEVGAGLLRLAVVNPLKNLFPGQNNPTLWALFGGGGQAQAQAGTGAAGSPSFPNLPSLGNFSFGGNSALASLGSSFATSSIGQALGLSTPILDTWALSSGGVNMLTPAGNAFIGALPGAAGALGGALAGYQSGSPIMGGLSGGLAAAALGAGPIGIGIAGIAGIAGGLFGRSAKERAERDRKEVERQQRIAQLLPALEQFYALAGEPMTGAGKVLADLTRQFQQLSSQAKALGLDTGLLADSFEKAQQRIRDDFAKGIEDAILAFENDALLGYRNLSKAHEERIREAIDAEADLDRVRHLNALELRRFFEMLSAEQLEGLGQAVHLAEILSAKLRETAGTLFSEIDAQGQLASSAESAARQAADAFRSIGETLRGTMEQLRGGDLSVLSAEQKLAERRGRFEEEATAALAGDRDALQRLGALARSFLQASQAHNGSTATYAADFDRVMDVLDRAGLAAGTQAGRKEDRAEVLGVQTALLRRIQEELGRPEGPDAAVLRGQLGVLSTIDGVLKGQTEVDVEQLRQMAGVSAGELTIAEQVAAGNARIASLLEEYLQLQEQERQERLRKQAEDAARAARQAQIDAQAAAARSGAAELSARIAAVRTVSPTTNSELAVEGFDPLVGSRLWTASDRGGAQFDRAGMLREILSGFARQLVEITGGTLDAQAAVYAGTKGGSGYRIGSIHKPQAFGINDYQGIVGSFVHDAAMQLGGIPDELRDAIAGISWTDLPGAFERLQREVLRIRDLETAEAAPVGQAQATALQAAPSAALAAPPLVSSGPPANDDRLLTRVEALTEEVRALRADNERLTEILVAVTADGARQVRDAVADNTGQTLKVERAIDRQTQAQLVA